MADSNNLLVRLRRWVHRQDENFTTEAFVHVLQRLLDNEPEAAARFLNRITSGAANLRLEEMPDVRLRTQVTTTLGRPDVEIRTKRHLIFLEAKVESDLGQRQLERYRSDLKESGFPATFLILLTRYPVALEDLTERPDNSVRWHELADWLAAELKDDLLRDAVSRHVVEQFIGYLSARGMTMEQVGHEMITGLHAMSNFIAMLGEAATAVNQRSVRPVGDVESIGFDLEKTKRYWYWVGFGYDEPNILYFEAYFTAINQEAMAALGTTEATKFSQGWWTWSKPVDLESEDVNFFSQTRNHQLQFLMRFIRESLAVGRQLRP